MEMGWRRLIQLSVLATGGGWAGWWVGGGGAGGGGDEGMVAKKQGLFDRMRTERVGRKIGKCTDPHLHRAVEVEVELIGAWGAWGWGARVWDRGKVDREGGPE